MSRADIVAIFKPVRESCDLTFVEYEREWGDGVDPQIYQGVGDLTTWESHASADTLLADTRPDRIGLLFTSSLNQVALRAAAKEHGIETIHIEHGYRVPAHDAPSGRTLVHRPAGKRLGGRRTHMFFARSLLHRRAAVAASLAHFGVAVARRGSTPEVLRAFAGLRRPDRYVSFSRECFAYHRDIDCVPPELAGVTTFTGVPQFDDFRVIECTPAGREALLIDHQFHRAGFFGWDLAFRRAWVDQLVAAVLGSGFERLHVKLHPGDSSGAWDAHRSNGRVEIVDRSELAELATRVSCVLGTFSTLQMPFAALPHTSMISLEIHPETGWFPSRRFVEAGIAEPVRSYEELAASLRAAEALGARQRPAKPAFTERFLDRLDGRAGERMAAALVAG